MSGLLFIYTQRVFFPLRLWSHIDYVTVGFEEHVCVSSSGGLVHAHACLACFH